MNGTVYVVHCIDTEGPLYESLPATFERLRDLFGLELEPRKETLAQLQAGAIDLEGLEAAVQKVVDPQLLEYNDTWDKVDRMLEDMLSPAFRNQMRDSFGGGWVYNWFCVDHVDYDINPRRRPMGYHMIFDHYRHMLQETDAKQDPLHFHFHPHPFNREAHRSATHWWAASDALYQVISRRVIDRQWFPAVNRPGFHVTRPDSHWFLEQYIPFDYANQSTRTREDESAQADLGNGRFGDWRRAPESWAPYHPSHDDYQVPGACRRWIARCLNVGTRYKLLEEEDVRQAFAQAQAGRPAVLAFTNHDFRDMRPDVAHVRKLLASVAPDFPDVAFKFAEAAEAMRKALDLKPQPACAFDMEMHQRKGAHVLNITTETPTFGPQPWLAIKTKGGAYHYDNLDIDTPFHSWQYVLDDHTFTRDMVETVGVAANNAFGVTTVATRDAATGAVSTKHWNQPATRDAEAVQEA